MFFKFYTLQSIFLYLFNDPGAKSFGVKQKAQNRKDGKYFLWVDT